MGKQDFLFTLFMGVIIGVIVGGTVIGALALSREEDPVTFPDIDGHWAEEWIEDAATEGYFVGYPDGTFGPDNQLTRAEAAVLVMKLRHGPDYEPEGE